VPSPVMATRCPAACSLRIRASLSSGLAWAMKSSTLLPCDGRCRHRVVSRDHDGLDPHCPEPLEAVFQPSFHNVFQMDGPSTFVLSATSRGVPPERETAFTAF